MPFRQIHALVLSTLLFLLTLPAAAGGGPTKRYIVELAPEFPAIAHARRIAARRGVRIHHVYKHVLNGFSIEATEAAAAAVGRDRAVTRVTADTLVRPAVLQSPAPAGLDRLDQIAAALDGTYSYLHQDGAGVRVFVLDTGVSRSATEFGDRLIHHEKFCSICSQPADVDELSGQQGQGHGTPAASIIAGSTYGVARSAQLVSVKVMSGGGAGQYSVPEVIQGLDWIAAERLRVPNVPMVANLSLESSANLALEAAVRNLVVAGDGVTVVVVAGNSTGDSCQVSPGRIGPSVRGLITVGATQATDNQIYPNTNTGPCIELFAPSGTTALSGNGSTMPFTHTSAAAPHVSGLAAWILSANPSYTPAQVEDTLRELAHPGLMNSGLPGTPDLIAGKVRPDGLPGCCSTPVTNAALRVYGGQFVSATNGGGSTVYANQNQIGHWETFTIVDLNGGALVSGDQVHIRATNGAYLSAAGGGGGAVTADRTTAAQWETFTIQKMNGTGTIGYADGVAFRSYTNHYLVAESGGNDVVKCDRTTAGAWETFALALPPGFAQQRPDVVWRAAAGGHVAWSMNGASVAATTQLPGETDTGWEVIGSGDFNGDGHRDLFWRRGSTANSIWFFDRTQLFARAPVIEVADPNIRLAGTGDFDEDGKADLFWRNDSTGENYLWLMNGANVGTAAPVTSAGTDWRVAGIADFSGDGKADIAWRNIATGENAIWLMYSGHVAFSEYITAVPQQEWKIVMTGDYNGDGMNDLFWRNEQNGSNAVWFLNGQFVSSTAYVQSESVSWRVVAGGDYDGDGKSDLLWRDSGDNTRVWLMNGSSATIQSSAPATGLVSVVAPSR